MATITEDISSINITTANTTQTYTLNSMPRATIAINVKLSSGGSVKSYTFNRGTRNTTSVSEWRSISYDGHQEFTFSTGMYNESLIGVTAEYEVDDGASDSDGVTTHDLSSITLYDGHSATFIMDNTASAGDIINFWHTFNSTIARAWKFTYGTAEYKDNTGYSVDYDGSKTFVISVKSGTANTFKGSRVTIESSGGGDDSGGDDSGDDSGDITPTDADGMEIITGRTGQQHVYATDDAQIHRCFLGSGDYVLHDGNELNASMTGATELTVYDGALIMQGRLAKIRPSVGSQVLTFDNGVEGYKRCDIVVAEYSRADDLESIDLKVVKGTNDSTAYIEPQAVTGNIDAGDTHQFKLYAVRFNGLNFDSLIDRRTFLTDAPINPLSDLIRSTRTEILSQLNTLESDTQAYVDEIAAEVGGKLSGHFTYSTRTWVSRTASQNAQVEITGTNAKSTDIFMVFLNGLKLSSGTYNVVVTSSGTINIQFVNITGTPDNSNRVEVEVLR